MTEDAWRETLTHLYERSRPQLRAVAARYVGHDAEDVVQDAFLSALRSGRAFRGDSAPLTWLHRIVVNNSIGRCRRATLTQIPFCDPIRPRTSVEGTFAIRSALRQLTWDQFHVFVLFEVLGHTHNEIASKLGIPLGTSKWYLANARQRLQELLSDRKRVGRPRRRAVV
jgi:RNA polymerase sigma-70 factor (ECF subfamily)